MSKTDHIVSGAGGIFAGAVSPAVVYTADKIFQSVSSDADIYTASALSACFLGAASVALVGGVVVGADKAGFKLEPKTALIGSTASLMVSFGLVGDSLYNDFDEHNYSNITAPSAELQIVKNDVDLSEIVAPLVEKKTSSQMKLAA